MSRLILIFADSLLLWSCLQFRSRKFIEIPDESDCDINRSVIICFSFFFFFFFLIRWLNSKVGIVYPNILWTLYFTWTSSFSTVHGLLKLNIKPIWILIYVLLNVLVNYYAPFLSSCTNFQIFVCIINNLQILQLVPGCDFQCFGK